MEERKNGYGGLDGERKKRNRERRIEGRGENGCRQLKKGETEWPTATSPATGVRMEEDGRNDFLSGSDAIFTQNSRKCLFVPLFFCFFFYQNKIK